jgi:hypothetical protein
MMYAYLSDESDTLTYGTLPTRPRSVCGSTTATWSHNMHVSVYVIFTHCARSYD